MTHATVLLRSRAQLRHLGTCSDPDLLALVRAGDDLAFAELYRRYEGEARRFARRLVGTEHADDVVAEAFTKVLQALRHLKGPADHPERYLMVTVRTTAASFYAKRGRRTALHNRLSTIEDLEDAPPLMEDDELVQAFKTLSPRWRKVIWWHEIEGRSPAEIGELLDLSPGAASALAYRARRALREAYAERVPEAFDMGELHAVPSTDDDDATR